jgi:hypothetical protein
MLGWWYSRGWSWILRLTAARLRTIGRIFAVKILIQTLFSPWKQIHTEATFRNFLRIALDNTISRVVGSVVRGTILFWSLILAILVIIFGVISFVVWPFLPLTVIILPLLTLSGVGS